jgi:hypothetical protein
LGNFEEGLMITLDDKMDNTRFSTWLEFLESNCDVEEVGDNYIWYSNVNCHYIVNSDTKEIEFAFGYHGKNLFEEREGRNNG